MSAKKIIIALSVMLAILAQAATVAAQTRLRTPFPDPYQEYIFVVNNFYKDRQQYTSAISQYKAYQTAQSKEDALDAAKKMLESGRVAIKQYIFILSANLSQQEEFNPRVKQAILTDLTVHNDYLDTAAQIIIDAKTTAEVTDLSKALDLRTSYVKATGTQALGYIDAVTAKKRIDESRTIVNKFNSIITGYPPENRSRGIIDKWVQEMIPALAQNETHLSEFVESLYPNTDRPREKPIFTSNRNYANNILLQGVISKQRAYANKFKEINQIARTAYEEL
ncbi:MAG: hypothetical protein M3Q44_06640 [bacterium]|nr:hypothetical protein [bacterium]